MACLNNDKLFNVRCNEVKLGGRSEVLKLLNLSIDGWVVLI